MGCIPHGDASSVNQSELNVAEHSFMHLLYVLFAYVVFSFSVLQGIINPLINTVEHAKPGA